jgi:hypothetical protein
VQFGPKKHAKADDDTDDQDDTNVSAEAEGVREIYEGTSSLQSAEESCDETQPMRTFTPLTLKRNERVQHRLTLGDSVATTTCSLNDKQLELQKEIKQMMETILKRQREQQEQLTVLRKQLDRHVAASQQLREDMLGEMRAMSEQIPTMRTPSAAAMQEIVDLSCQLQEFTKTQLDSFIIQEAIRTANRIRQTKVVESSSRPRRLPSSSARQQACSSSTMPFPTWNPAADKLSSPLTSCTAISPQHTSTVSEVFSNRPFRCSSSSSARSSPLTARTCTRDIVSKLQELAAAVQHLQEQELHCSHSREKRSLPKSHASMHDEESENDEFELPLEVEELRAPTSSTKRRKM